MGVPLSDLIDPSKRAALAALASGEEVKDAEPSLADAAIRDARTLDVKVAETELEGKAMTHESLDRSPKHNWVEDAGGLPAYIEHIAKDIAEKRGVPLSRAIPIAIGAVKRWARGGGGVNADTRAKAAAAVAEWEKLKAKNAAKGAAKDAAKADDEPLEVKNAKGSDGDHDGKLNEKHKVPGPYSEDGIVVRPDFVQHPRHEHVAPLVGARVAVHRSGYTTGGTANPVWRPVEGKLTQITKEKHGLSSVADTTLHVESGGKTHKIRLADVGSVRVLGATKTDEDLETKDEAPTGEMEHKSATPGTAVLSTDDATGVVEAIVSVTGIADRVDDIIEPGAYTSTLANHEPIGVWSHDDKTWVARAEEVKELPPGDPGLPKVLNNGQPWPKEAGALYVKSRFNLETPHGAAAYSDVKFFKGKTGWSIGYRVTNSKRDVRTGVRRIKSLNLYEFSPVMVGAAPQSMTLSVKSLSQPVDADEVPEVAVELLGEDEVKGLLEARDAIFDGLDLETKGRFVEALHPRNAGKFASKPGAGAKAKVSGDVSQMSAVPAGSVAPLLDVVPPAYVKGMPQALAAIKEKHGHHIKALKTAQIEAIATVGAAEILAMFADHLSGAGAGHDVNIATSLSMAAAFALHKSIKHGTGKEKKADPGAAPADAAPADPAAPADDGSDAAIQAISLVIQDELDNMPDDAELDDDTFNALMNNVASRLSEALNQVQPPDAAAAPAQATPPPAAPAGDVATKDLLANLEAKAHWTDNLGGKRPEEKARGGKNAQPSPGEVASATKAQALADDMNAKARDSFRKGTSGRLDADQRAAHVALGEGLLDGESILRAGGGAAELGQAAAKAKVEGKHPMHVEALLAAAADHHEATEAMDDDELNQISAAPDLFPHEKQMIDQARALPPHERRGKLREMAGVKSFVDDLEEKADRFVRTDRGSVRFGKVIGSRIGGQGVDPVSGDPVDAPTRPDENGDEVTTYAAEQGMSNEAAADHLHQIALEEHADAQKNTLPPVGAKISYEEPPDDWRGKADNRPGKIVSAEVLSHFTDEHGQAWLWARQGAAESAIHPNRVLKTKADEPLEGEEGFDLEAKDVFTSSAPAASTSGFGGGKSQHAITGDTLATARPKCPACGSKSVTMIGGRHCAMCGTPVGKPGPVGDPAVKVDHKADEDVLNLEHPDDDLEAKAWSDAARAAALAARRAHGGGETPEREYLRTKVGARGQKLAVDLEPGDHVNFTKPGPGGMSDPKTVAGAVEGVDIQSGAVHVKVGGETHKLTHHSPVTVELGTHQFSDADKEKIRARFAKMTKKADDEPVEEKAWSPASRIAALAARRAHHHEAEPEIPTRQHQGPALRTEQMHIEGHDESPEESAAKATAAHAKHAAAGKDYGNVHVTPHEGTNLHEARSASGTILSLHATPEAAHAYASAYNKARKLLSEKGEEVAETKTVRINEHEILAASRLRLLVD